MDEDMNLFNSIDEKRQCPVEPAKHVEERVEEIPPDYLGNYEVAAKMNHTHSCAFARARATCRLTWTSSRPRACPRTRDCARYELIRTRDCVQS